MDVHEMDQDGRNQMQKEEVCHLYAETRENIYLKNPKMYL